MFTIDQHRIVTVSQDQLVRTWELAVQEGWSSEPLDQTEGTLDSPSFDDRRVAIFYGAMVRGWDVVTGHPTTPLLKHDGPVAHASFSPDGHWIVTTTKDGIARVWDTITGQLVTRLSKSNSPLRWAKFSPDGHHVVAVSDKAARVWDVATGQPVTPPLEHGSPVGGASFSPDGRRVVTTSGDGTARIWDATTGQPVTPPLRA